MVLGKQISRESRIGVRHSVFIDLTSDMASVSRNVLSTDLVSRASNPILSVFAPVSEDVSVHFGRSSHALVSRHRLSQG